MYGLERRSRPLDGNGGADPSSGIGALDVEASAFGFSKFLARRSRPLVDHLP